MKNKQALADSARRAAAQDPNERHPRVRDLWPTHAGPNVLAWSYKDTDPACETVYTVFVAYPGGRPRLQLAFANGNYTQVPVTNPERFGTWASPREFKAWARTWYEEGTSRA